MYCVIPKVPVKKVSCGEAREIIVTELNWTSNGVQHIRYGYCKGGGYFERPHKVAYRISIHRSYWESGKVRKKQVAICTIGYYDFIDFSGWYRDYINGSLLKDKLDILGISEEELDGVVFAKLDPIIDQIREEFRQTEEYAVTEEHRRILNTYNQNADGFAKR